MKHLIFLFLVVIISMLQINNLASQDDIQSILENYSRGDSEIILIQSIKDVVDSQLLKASDINALGNEYLFQKDKPNLALMIFKTNTEIFPNSANVFDGYGAALMKVGDLHASMESYQNAVDIATKNEDEDLHFYKERLQEVKDKISKK